MPKKQLRVCAEIGCRTLVYGGRCDKHKRETHTASKAYRHLYNNSRWKKFRVLYLAERPFCAVCGGRSDVVDHIKDHKGDVNIFWDEGNLQPLCKHCHDKKTAQENSLGRLREPPHHGKV